MSSSTLRIALFFLLLRASPALAAFEAFSDHIGDWLLISASNREQRDGQLSITRIERYGLPELALNSLTVSTGLPGSWLGQKWAIGLNLDYTGDELDSETHSSLGIKMMTYSEPLRYLSLAVGSQSLQAKGYGRRNQPVLSAGLLATPICGLLVEAYVDQIALPGGSLPVTASIPVGRIRVWHPLGNTGIGAGYYLREHWAPQLFLYFNWDVSRHTMLNLLWRDNPELLGCGISYVFDEYSLAISYRYQPVIGSVRSFALGMAW